jgi:hypothetical protein
MSGALLGWLGAFCLTQALETPVYLLAQRASGRSGLGALAVAFAASAWTHPIVWFVFPLLPRTWGCAASIRCWYQQVVLAEAFAVLVEAAWLWRRGVPRALLWSLAANGLSFTAGALLLW